jgi:DNA-binding response OmpR family regulator
MAERILLIEDDEALGAQIVQHLREAGFEPTWITDGAAAPLTLDPAYRLVILDLMLPGTSGMDLLKRFRARSDVPVLILSARNDTSDRVRTLRLGADDYLGKPFWPEELVERVRARLRRPALQRGGVLEVGSLSIDFHAREVRVEDKAVQLTAVEFELLAVLARRGGGAVTRQVLVEQVLDPERDGGERTLDVHVSRLRRKLGHPTWIVTVWGIGYRLAAGADA